MNRFIDTDFLNWKNNKRRKPLLVRGARQIGKTYSIKQFGNEHFNSFVTIDFERNKNIIKIFETDLDPKRIIRDLEFILNKKITSKNTLLFFDEIQECPQAIIALRYFYEEMPDLHVIAAGSLLEFALSSLSFPVGRIQILNMHPMTFPEFLMGVNYIDAAKIILSEPIKLSETIHEHLINQLRIYFFVGGMPECVATYKETNSIKEAHDVQNEITSTYKMDFPKYQPKVNTDCLDMVFSSVAIGTGKQLKYSSLAEGYSNPTIKKAFETLRLARLFFKVSSCNPPEYPLGVSASEKKFKTVFLDIGLMQNLSGIKTELGFLETKLLNIYKGALAEQFIGQEFLAAQNNELYYWSRDARNSLSEVDYLITKQNKIVPVEVKSGSSGRLKSMHLFLEKYSSDYGIVFSTRPYQELPDQKLKFIPLYYAYSVAKL